MSAASITSVSQFAEACKTLDSEAIFNLFEYELTEEMRDKIAAFSENIDTPEPLRAALYEIGMQYNVQALIDY